MNTQRLSSLFGLLLLGTLLLAACTSGNPALTGEPRDQVLAYTDPIADNMLQGLKDGDYNVFSRDFNDKMKAAIKQADFEKMRQQLNDRIGAYQSHEITQVVDYGKMTTATYKGVFEKANSVQILVTVTKEEPHQVTGLYFK